MYPKLYNGSGQLLAVLDNIIKETAIIYRIINGEFTFSFEAYEQELKSEYFDPVNSLIIDNQTFDIKYIEKKHELDVVYTIECEHVNYRMADGAENLLESYAFTGTPSQILANMLTGTDFSVGIVDFIDIITISVNKEITRKELIKELANLIGAEIDYTDQGFTINLLDTIGQDNGFEVRFGKNLKGITKTIDTRGGLKTYYEIDILELKNSNEYILKGLQDLEVIEVGDTIRIIDEVIGLNIENRILSIESNPIFAVNTTLEITNKLELVTDNINEIATTAVIQEKLYNNAAISAEYGFRATRSDKLARTTLGSDNISMDVGDGLGGYTPAMYFDPLEGKYKFVGDIDASGTITAATIIGSSINNGAGTFTVDAIGNVVANSLTIGGGSGIANLSDAGALAVLDSVDFNSPGQILNSGDLATLNSISATYIDSNAVTTPKIAAGAVIASKILVGELSAISADLGTVTAGDIFGVKYFGYGASTAYMEIGAGGGNLADLTLNRSSSDVFCQIRDVVPGVSLRTDASGSDTLEVLSSYNGNTYMKNDWYYNNNEVISYITAGTGLLGSGDGPTRALSIDFTDVPKTTSGQSIEFQIYDGRLEWRLSGGTFTALANLSDLP